MKLSGQSYLLVRFDAEEGNRVSAAFTEKGLKVQFSRRLHIAAARKAKAKKGAKHVARA